MSSTRMPVWMSAMSIMALVASVSQLRIFGLSLFQPCALRFHCSRMAALNPSEPGICAFMMLRLSVREIEERRFRVADVEDDDLQQLRSAAIVTRHFDVRWLDKCLARFDRHGRPTFHF